MRLVTCVFESELVLTLEETNGSDTVSRRLDKTQFTSNNLHYIHDMPNTSLDIEQQAVIIAFKML